MMFDFVVRVLAKNDELTRDTAPSDLETILVESIEQGHRLEDLGWVINVDVIPVEMH